MVLQITNDVSHREAMAAIEVYLLKGFSNLSAEETFDLERITKMIKAYEDIHYSLPIQPQNLIEMIELRMYQERLNQKALAQKLGTSETRVSELLKGKRKVNFDLAKKLHEILNINADFILKMG